MRQQYRGSFSLVAEKFKSKGLKEEGYRNVNTKAYPFLLLSQSLVQQLSPRGLTWAMANQTGNQRV